MQQLFTIIEKQRCFNSEIFLLRGKRVPFLLIFFSSQNLYFSSFENSLFNASTIKTWVTMTFLFASTTIELLGSSIYQISNRSTGSMYFRHFPTVLPIGIDSFGRYYWQILLADITMKFLPSQIDHCEIRNRVSACGSFYSFGHMVSPSRTWKIDICCNHGNWFGGEVENFSLPRIIMRDANIGNLTTKNSSSHMKFVFAILSRHNLPDSFILITPRE